MILERLKLKSSRIFLGGASALLILLPVAFQAQGADKGITIVLSEQPDTIDGCESTASAAGRIILNNVVEGLTQIDTETGAIVPRLATSWEMVDANRWRFKLREGVSFHDGAPLDASAVAYSIKRNLSKNMDCSQRTRYFGNLVLSPEPVDAHTLDIVTEDTQPILPTYMAWLQLVSPNTPEDRMSLTPVGTGPYEMDESDRSVEIKVKRNDAWWGVAPEVDSVRFVWRTESSVRAAMVEVGEADMAPNIGQQDANAVGGMDVRDIAYTNAETAHLRIDTLVPPLDDQRVRIALNVALDREAMRGTVFPKEVEVATNMVLPGVSGHNPNLKPWPYDPDRARKLLAEAKADGVPVDTEIVLNGRSNLYPNSQEAMEAMHAMWEAAGFNMKLQMMEVGQWRKWNARPFPEGRPPNLLQTRHNNQSGDVEFTAFAQWDCDGGRAAVCNPDLDAKIEEATNLTGDARVEAWHDVMRMVYEEDIANVFLFHLIGYARVGPRIDYKPDFLTYSAIDLTTITFK